MQPNSQSAPQIPELQDIAQKHVVDALEGKVERCYSKDRHDVFQADVISIVHRELAGDDARKKFKEWTLGLVRTELVAQGVEKKKFLVPIIISIVSAIGSIGAVVVALIK